MIRFTPLAQDIFICLRCQHNKRIRNRTLSNHLKPLRASPPWWRAFTTGRALYTEGLIRKHVLRKYRSRHLKIRPKIVSYILHGEEGFPDQDSRKKIKTRWQDNARPYNAKGRYDELRYYEGDTFTLGVSALGGPAQIRVVKGSEDNSASARRNFLSTTDSTEPRKAIDSEEILQTIAAETGIIDQDSVIENIEQLRKQLLPSKDVAHLPALSQCRNVSQQLSDGFTNHQLTEYMSKTSSTLTDDFLDLRERFFTDDFARSAWFVGSSSFPAEASNRLDPSSEKLEKNLIGLLPEGGRLTQTRKQRVIEKILRYSWKIRTREENVMEGELDMRLKQEHLDLLLNYRTDLFDSLAQQYRAKIDVSQSRRVIRITADFATCQELFKLIYFTFSNIRCSDFILPDAHQLTNEARRVLNDESSLDHLRRLTSTLIVPIRSEQETIPSMLRVYYVGPETTGFEDVRRLFYQLMKPDPATSGQVVYEIGATKTPIQARMDGLGSLPWTEKGLIWTRWRCALNRKAVPENKNDNISEEHAENLLAYPDGKYDTKKSIAQFLYNRLPAQAINTQATEPSAHWHSYQNQMLTAVFGSITHPEVPYQPPESDLSQAEQEEYARDFFRRNTTSRRVMLPGIAKILETFQFLSQEPLINHELRIRLSPIATNEGTPVQRLPDIEIGIKIVEIERRTILEDVRLIVEERVSDLLLPEDSVDIRFNNVSYITAPRKQIDDRIMQFIKESKFDIWGTSRIMAPPRLRISIPRYALRIPISTASTDVKESSGDFVEAEYAQVGLEHRSNMFSGYQGFPIRYTTVEGGQSGGRKDECGLFFPDPNINYEGKHLDKVAVPPNFAKFYDVVRDFVNRVKQAELPHIFPKVRGV